MRIAELGTSTRETNLGVEGTPPGPQEAANIRAALAAIPDTDILGVMSCPISPESVQECLVCRLLKPVTGLTRNEAYREVSTGVVDHWGYRVTQDWTCLEFAKRYHITYDQAQSLFGGAAGYTGFVEELIADRLDDILFGKGDG